MEDDAIKATVLYHLRRKKVMGGVHTHFDTVTKGFPGHLKKDVKDAAKGLVKKEWVLTKPASYGLQISLNKDKLQEIEEFIERIMGFKF